MRIILLLLLSVSFVFSKQETADTQDETKEFYYKLGTGFVAEEDATSWHLAVKTGFIAGTIRANKNVNVYEALVLSIDDIETPIAEADLEDETKFKSVVNSNEDWLIGAFNIGGMPEQANNYGWGEYFQGDGLYGQKLYVLEIVNKGQTTYKQFAIESMQSGNYNFIMADLDGSNFQELSVPKSDFEGKIFGYVNILSGETLDLQPLASDWDFYIGEYKDQLNTGPGGFIPYNVLGFLTHPNIRVAEKPNDNTEVPEDSDYSYVVNTIGHDWKSLNSTFDGFDLEPVTYYIQRTSVDQEGNITIDGPTYKLDFIEFVGFSEDRVVFEINAITTSVDEETANFGIFPNVVEQNSKITLVHSFSGMNTIGIYNSFGERVHGVDISGNGNFSETSINIPNLTPGMYFINLDNRQFSKSLKFIVK